MAAPQLPERSGPLVASGARDRALRKRRIVTIAAALAVFAIVTLVVFRVRPGLDARLVVDAGRLRTPSSDWLMVRVADLGAWFVLGPVTLVAVAALVIARRPWSAALMAASVMGAEIIQVTLKALFERPRPEVTVHLEHILSASYPSGHATVSCAFALALCLVLAPLASRPAAIALVAGAALYVVAVGFARVFLGVHYPTDVIAGWSLAVAWVAAADLAVRALRPPLKSA